MWLISKGFCTEEEKMEMNVRTQKQAGLIVCTWRKKMIFKFRKLTVSTGNSVAKS